MLTVRFPQANMVGYDDKVWHSIQSKGVYSKACLDGEFLKDNMSVHQSIVKELMKDMSKEYKMVA